MHGMNGKDGTYHVEKVFTVCVCVCVRARGGGDFLLICINDLRARTTNCALHFNEVNEKL